MTVFTSVILADLAFLVLGWFKMSGFFYFQRFGIKRENIILHRKKRSMVGIAKETGDYDEDATETEQALKNRMM